MPAHRPLRFLVAAVVLLLVAAVAVLTWRDFKSKRSPNQALFMQGTIPRALPDGDYKGHVAGYSGDWIGKTFDAKRGTGKILIRSAKDVELLYPFKTFVGSGLADPV